MLSRAVAVHRNVALARKSCRLYTNLSIASLTDEHRFLRESCRDFADNELKPIAHVTDKEHKFPGEAIRAMGDLGLMSVAIDSEYGGTGMDYKAYAIAMEEISRGNFRECYGIINLSDLRISTHECESAKHATSERIIL